MIWTNISNSSVNIYMYYFIFSWFITTPAMFNLSLECISPIYFKQTCTTLIYLQFYDNGVMFMDSVPFGGKSSEHFANHHKQFSKFEVLIAVLDMTLTSHAGEWYRMVAAQAISVKGWYKSSNDQTTSLFSLKNSHSPFEKSPWILQTWIKSI